ncbi:DUF1990 domain-containing protein [Actinokineospora globicatena]|uniref:DUF1990 domain-containing protein n=1 Tax=Actinokineospora globicatena TaxID=103729 RepID=UPI0020A372C3|nr:DUF1990 domain-containing protein [Actinokineospora globicatena]MCP2302280.1 Uncharacterized protein, UPF0548 family [Actinokineospora globicatena]GLW76054.1 hypothetical protein Aglo01_05360 [Actinokineospora globicatena]GLW82889.1 hypothetical protein Aglo02_05290 [Actinokineospora globicatena]
MRVVLSRPDQPSTLLADLTDRRINYSPTEVGRGWFADDHPRVLGYERPGPPGELWARARELVAGYEFAPPELIQAHYATGSPLLGRHMVLEGRFLFARFLMGVRVTEVIDESTPTCTRWGWSYETLTGHLERGKVTFQVTKSHTTGRVEFRATSYSKPSHTAHPLIRLGWAIFGRATQRRFYRRIGEQMVAFTAPTPITTAPTLRSTPHTHPALTLIDAG